MNSLGAQRIVQMVRPQLEAVAVSPPLLWRPYRAFILGYIVALADLQACNGGKQAEGPESRALTRSVLRLLCGDLQAEPLVIESVQTTFRRSADFAGGQRSALDDYDRWSLQAMSSIETFVDAMRGESARRDAQAPAAFADTPRAA